MTTSISRKFALVISAIFGSISLTSCGAGLTAPTAMIKQVTDGAEADAGAIKVRNLLVIAQPDGSGTLVGSIVNSGGPADSILLIGINYQIATLTGTSVLATNSPVQFAGASTNAQVSVPTLGAKPGSMVVVEIRFENAGSIKVNALVRERAGEFADVGTNS